MLGFLGLLFVSGVDYISFATGLLVGMTIIQVYFHRFSAALPPDKSPEPPVSAIQADVICHTGGSRQSVARTHVDDVALHLGTVHGRGAWLWFGFVVPR
jgi:hypothetical protein